MSRMNCAANHFLKNGKSFTVDENLIKNNILLLDVYLELIDHA